MAGINTYSDDTTTTDNDRLLTYASDGSTKLTPASNLNKYLGDGWTISGDSWTYSSYNSTTTLGVINTNSGANTKYIPGMWVKFTQPTLGIKYGKIIATTTSTITVRFTSATVLSNEAITAPYFSAAAQPFRPSSTSDSFIISSSNLGSRSQTLTASGSGTVAYSTNNPTIQLAPGSYLLVATASTTATISTQDSSFKAVIYNDTSSAEIDSAGVSSTGISGVINRHYTAHSIVTPTSSTTYSGRASQTFGSGAAYAYVDSSLIAIPLNTTDV